MRKLVCACVCVQSCVKTVRVRNMDENEFVHVKPRHLTQQKPDAVYVNRLSSSLTMNSNNSHNSFCEFAD